MEILERAATKCGSWGKLAKELGISRQQMSHLKMGKYTPSPAQLGKCAEICGERWWEHALPALMNQEKTPEGRAFWKGKLERLLTTAAMVLVATFWVQVSQLGDTNLEAGSLNKSINSPRLIYIMSSYTVSEISGNIANSSQLAQLSMTTRFAVAALILMTAWARADAPDPIHHDETPQPTMEPVTHLINGTNQAYVLGHLETRQVAARPVEVCYQLTDHIVNDDFMKCRHGYSYQAWVPGHYIKAPP